MDCMSVLFHNSYVEALNPLRQYLDMGPPRKYLRLNEVLGMGS